MHNSLKQKHNLPLQNRSGNKFGACDFLFCKKPYQ